MGNDSAPSGEFDDWEIVGYGTQLGGDWHVSSSYADNEFGYPSRDFDREDLDWVDEITVRYTDESGGEHFYTLNGPWDDYDEFVEEIEDLWSDYGGEAA